MISCSTSSQTDEGHWNEFQMGENLNECNTSSQMGEGHWDESKMGEDERLT